MVPKLMDGQDDPRFEEHPRSWTNTIFLTVAHAIGAFAVVYIVVWGISWWTVGLAAAMSVVCGLAITGGYHRLFSHSTYQASPLLRAFYLYFGAAGVQNSALAWSADHRAHHANCDEEGDPYNIKRGFWWAHMGWVLRHVDKDPNMPLVKNLLSDPLVRFQHKYYIPLAVLSGVIMPYCLGLIWGDPVGAVLVAGFLRLVLQWHTTFSINSLAHMVGTRPYSKTVSARDSFWLAFITLGEGYHNFHHRFQRDYRNGIRWFHFDPTKWWVWSMSKLRLAGDLRRTPKERIEEVKRATREAANAA